MRKLYSLLIALVVTVTAMGQTSPTYRERSGASLTQGDQYLSVIKRLGIPTAATDALEGTSTGPNSAKILYNTTTQSLRVYDPVGGIWKDASASDLSNYYTKAEIDALMAAKQAILISGDNIKTINGQSILGPGNITISGSNSSEIPEWIPGTYTKDAVVTLGTTKLIRSTADNNTSDPNLNSPWRYLGEVSDVKVWNNTTSYVKGDTIQYEVPELTLIAIALVDNTGKNPGAPDGTWDLVGVHPAGTDIEYDPAVSYEPYAGVYPFLVTYQEGYWAVSEQVIGVAPAVNLWETIYSEILAGNGLEKMGESEFRVGGVLDKQINWLFPYLDAEHFSKFQLDSTAIELTIGKVGGIDALGNSSLSLAPSGFTLMREREGSSMRVQSIGGSGASDSNTIAATANDPENTNEFSWFRLYADRNEGSYWRANTGAQWMFREESGRDLGVRIQANKRNDGTVQNNGLLYAGIHFSTHNTPNGYSNTGDYTLGGHDQSTNLALKIPTLYRTADQVIDTTSIGFTIERPSGSFGLGQIAGKVLNAFYRDGRVSGTAATLPNQFVTKAQLDASTGGSVDLGSGLHKGTDGKINLGLDLTTIGTTNGGLLTKDLFLVRGDVPTNNFNSIAINDNEVLITSTDSENTKAILSLEKTLQPLASIGVMIDSDRQNIVFVNTTEGQESRRVISVSDQVNNKGIEYDEDYSDNQIADNNAIPSVLAVKKLIASEGGGSSGISQWVAGTYAKNTPVTTGDLQTGFSLYRSNIDNNTQDPNAVNPWDYVEKVANVSVWSSSASYTAGTIVSSNIGIEVLFIALQDNTNKPVTESPESWSIAGVLATPVEYNNATTYEPYAGVYPTVVSIAGDYFKTSTTVTGITPALSTWDEIARPLIAGSGLTKDKNKISFGGIVENNTGLAYKNWRIMFSEDSFTPTAGVISFNSGGSDRSTNLSLSDEEQNGGLTLSSNIGDNYGTINVGGNLGLGMNGNTVEDNVRNGFSINNGSGQTFQKNYSYLELENTIQGDPYGKRSVRIRSYGNPDYSNDIGDAGVFISNTNIYKNGRYSDAVKLKEPLKISGEAYYGYDLSYESTDTLLQIGHKIANQVFVPKNSFFADGRVNGAYNKVGGEFVTDAALKKEYIVTKRTNGVNAPFIIGDVYDYGDGRIVAVQANRPNIHYSTDNGLNWTEVYTSTETSGAVQGILRVVSGAVIVATGKFIVHSEGDPNGPYTASDISSFGVNFISSITDNGAYYIAATGTPLGLRSTDLVNWTAITFPSSVTYVTGGDGILVGTTSSGGVVSSSNNGDTMVGSSVGGVPVAAPFFMDGKFYVLQTNADAVFESTNGETWFLSNIYSPRVDSNNPASLYYLNGKLIGASSDQIGVYINGEWVMSTVSDFSAQPLTSGSRSSYSNGRYFIPSNNGYRIGFTLSRDTTFQPTLDGGLRYTEGGTLTTKTTYMYDGDMGAISRPTQSITAIENWLNGKEIKPFDGMQIIIENIGTLMYNESTKGWYFTGMDNPSEPPVFSKKIGEAIF